MRFQEPPPGCSGGTASVHLVSSQVALARDWPAPPSGHPQDQVVQSRYPRRCDSGEAFGRFSVTRGPALRATHPTSRQRSRSGGGCRGRRRQGPRALSPGREAIASTSDRRGNRLQSSRQTWPRPLCNVHFTNSYCRENPQRQETALVLHAGRVKQAQPGDQERGYSGDIRA